MRAAGESAAENAVVALLRAWAPHHRASGRPGEPAECPTDAQDTLSSVLEAKVRLVEMMQLRHCCLNGCRHIAGSGVPCRASSR